MEEDGLQAHSDTLFYTGQVHLPKGGTAPGGLGPPTSIGNQEKAHMCPQANLMRHTHIHTLKHIHSQAHTHSLP